MSALCYAEKGGTQLSASAYHLLPADLRHGQDQLFGALAAILSTEQPLLVLAECVFPYMTSTDSGSLLRWFSSTFDDVGVVVYEMFGLHDSFGKVMHTNLQVCGTQAGSLVARATLMEQSLWDRVVAGCAIAWCSRVPQLRLTASKVSRTWI